MSTPTDVRTLDADTVAHLQQWIGRSQTLHDTIGASPVSGLSATLDRDDPAPAKGTEVPPLGHWMYFLPQPLQREIGHDGHPTKGGFMPPVPLPRRMFAGGRVFWEEGNRLRVGDVVTRTTTIEKIVHKAGRTGDLLFVTIKHVVANENGTAITEENDIVYRGAAQPGEPAPAPTMAETGAAWRREITPDPVLLFRYSALTFNGHRIHYDRPYTTQEEGYPGLVVHGPLLATLLTDLVRREKPEAFIKSFAFKAVRPTFDLNPFWLNGQLADDGKALKLWGNDHEGALTIQATAELL